MLNVKSTNNLVWTVLESSKVKTRKDRCERTICVCVCVSVCNQILKFCLKGPTRGGVGGRESESSVNRMFPLLGPSSAPTSLDPQGIQMIYIFLLLIHFKQIK